MVLSLRGKKWVIVLQLGPSLLVVLCLYDITFKSASQLFVIVIFSFLSEKERQ